MKIFKRSKNKQLKYFISFSAIENGVTIFGNVDISRLKPINSIMDIREAEHAIASVHTFTNVIIITWQKLV